MYICLSLVYTDYTFPIVFNKFNDILSEKSKIFETSKDISDLDINKFIEKSIKFFNEKTESFKQKAKYIRTTKKQSYGVFIYLCFFHGKKIFIRELKDKIDDEK